MPAGRTGLGPDETLRAIRAWGEARDWSGYDPYDALNSPAVPVLTLGTPLGRRVLTQAVKLSPVNVRPLLRIRPARNTKAIGLVAGGYARLAASGDDDARASMQRWFDWLRGEAVESGEGVAWGYHFDVQTRICFYGRGTPNTIATSFVAHALLDAAELVGDDEALALGARAAQYLREHMLTDAPGGPYFRYLTLEPELVHNANLLGCSVVARAGRLLERPDLVDAAAPAVRTTLAAQQPDGSWRYGNAAYLSWIDNFHTAYVLESLAECLRSLPEVREPLVRGVEFWEQNLFLPDGTPKFYADDPGPLDAHNVSSAIDAWLAVSDLHPGALDKALRLARILSERLLDPAGYVRFQRRRLWTNRTPFVRWTTAPAFHALAGLLPALDEAERPRQAVAAGSEA